MNDKGIIEMAVILAFLVEYHYRCCGIHVKLQLHRFLADCRQFVFQIIPKPGTRTAAIFDRAADVQKATQIPLFQPFEKGVQIFLSVSTDPVRKNSLWKILTSPAFRNSDKVLPIALGCDLAGEMVIEDLKKMVHALYVGAPNSGKSTGLMCLILSLICSRPASEVNLIIIDTEADSLEGLEGIPHLSHPVVKDRDVAAYVIQSLKDEMHRRYGIESSQRNNLPKIVCVIDEFVTFMDNIDNKQQRQTVIGNISNLLRLGRKTNIHFVLATQDSKSEKMAVEISNITSRMAFRVDRHQTSSTILSRGGAEKLPGEGAFLYQSAKYPKSIYVQGANISDGEIAQLVERVKVADQDLGGKFVIPEPVSLCFPASLSVPLDAVQTDNEDEQELASIILWTLGREDVSSLKIKETFKMGNRADTIIDKLCGFGLLSEKFANQPRRVLPQSVEEVSQTVMDLLTRRGVSVDDVAAALSKRNPDNETDHGEEYGHDANC